MKESTQRTEYHIHRFMYGLGIKGSALMVYAALYSFTMGERGLFHGSQKYLADSIGVSVRTVQNALGRLRSLGLIEGCETPDGLYRGIRCIRPEEREEKQASAPSDIKEEKAISEKVDEPLFEPDLPESASEQEKNTLAMMRRYERSGDNRRFLRFGKEGKARMTEPQYKRLLALLPTEELMPYLMRLENMLTENESLGKKPPHSHYKTLKKWIEEDLAL